MSEIGYMKKMLIGVSCMQNGQNELLKNAWRTRFAGNDINAIFVEAGKNQEPEEVLAVICETLKNQGIHNIQSKVVLAVFAYMLDREQAAFIPKMKMMRKMLYETLACTLEEQIVFEYLDDCTMASRTVRIQLREAIKDSLSDSFKTILVGRFALTPEEELWRSELALLDVLCRDTDELSGKLLYSSFGFLKYGRYHQEERSGLLMQLQRLDKKLHNDNTESLKEKTEQYIRENITDIIMEQCTPEEGMAPIAPGMLVTGGRFKFWSQKKAKEGKDPDYNKARSLTEEAVRETAEDMKDYADKLSGALTQDACNILWTLIDSSDIGINALKKQDDMIELLQNFRQLTSHEEINLYGCIEMNEIQKRIYNYLKDVMLYAQAYAERSFRTALVNAYSGISEECWNEKEMTYRNEYQNTLMRLNQYPDLDAFCDAVFAEKPFLYNSFRPIVGKYSASENWFLLHGDNMKKMNKNSNITCIHYDSKLTGYAKAEVLVTFFYSNIRQNPDEIINDLLKLEE